jgi:hypothetical protein
MVMLEYSLDPSEKGRTESVDLAQATQEDFDFRLFCGDIVFRVGTAVFDARWGWVPVVGFAVELQDILSQLATEEEGELHFTESSATVSFRRVGSAIKVSATYTPDKATVPFQELHDAVNEFLRRLLAGLRGEWPQLQDNLLFQQWSALVT